MDARRMDCPSAQPDMDNARPLGVLTGHPGEVRIAFFKRDALAGFDWREKFAGPESTHVLRFAAKCEHGKCGHYKDGRCSLGERVRDRLPAVVDVLPPCLIRSTCRWHAEQGDDVCLRCPQVATMVPASERAVAEVAVGP